MTGQQAAGLARAPAGQAKQMNAFGPAEFDTCMDVLNQFEFMINQGWILGRASRHWVQLQLPPHVERQLRKQRICPAAAPGQHSGWLARPQLLQGRMTSCQRGLVHFGSWGHNASALPHIHGRTAGGWLGRSSCQTNQCRSNQPTRALFNSAASPVAGQRAAEANVWILILHHSST